MTMMCSFFYLILSMLVCSSYGGGAPNPDLSRNVTQMIQARGYPVEDHYAITPDGFVLSIQRITGPQNKPGTPNVQKPVVLLQHGLIDNSITWVIQEVVNESLGFILADAGYDVWLSNVRGNTYSNTNVHYNPSQAEFWAWSFDEMAHIDLPTILGYILKETNQETLSYVGHSQGTTMGFVGFENPEIASKVNVFIALAPVGWVYHTQSILLKAMADLDATVLVQLLGIEDFAPDNSVLKILLPGVCSQDPDACDNLMGLVTGWDTTNLNSTRIPVMLAHEPSGTSTQNIIHWCQEVKQNVFQEYDFGSPAENRKHYNTTTPPSFNPSLVTLPTALFSGGNDALADPTDVAVIASMLKNVVYSHFEPTYAHLDFVWGTNANMKIYPQVLQLIAKYSTNTANSNHHDAN